MTTADEKLTQALDKLIAEGNRVSATFYWEPNVNRYNCNNALLQMWVTRCSNLLVKGFGDDSEYVRHFKEGTERHAKYTYPEIVQRLLGVVMAACQDIADGLLFDRDLLIAADVFDDILEQAEHLLENKYKDAAASLVAASLETTLRKLCVKRGIQLTGTETLEPLNVLLAKHGVYNKLVQKQITAWGDIRNNADHGHHDQYKQSDVEDMLKWVRSFIGDYLK